jgi:hypothetical protein
MPKQRSQKLFELGEFWLSRRSDGVTDAWQITWYDERKRQTRQRSTGTADFELAKHRLAEYYIARGKREQEPAAGVLIEHVLMRYYETHAKNLASAKFAAYAISHWARFWSAETVGAITDERMDEFKQDLVAGERHGLACVGAACPVRVAKRANRRSPATGCVGWEMNSATIRRVLGVGRAALKRAVRKKELAGAPHIQTVKVRKKRLYRASLQEMAALLNASEGMPWLRQWIIGSLVTVARPEAVLQLSRPQLDFANRLIDMNPPGRETTIKGRPIIPMTQTAFDNMGGAWTGLWITYRGKPLSSIRMGFERARRRAGLTEQITPYTIRRTISTQLRKRGVPLEEIAGFLGHTEDEYEVTEDYAIYSPDYLGLAAKAIDAYCLELDSLLDSPLMRTSCVPEGDTVGGSKGEQVTEIQMVGRLGLEPRTNTLKASCLSSKIRNLKVRK